MLEFDELLPPLLGQGNDWTLFQRAVELRFPARSKPAYTLPVSVVIPVYNRREKLGKTIAALTHSSFPLSLIEIVIADDGSSDSPESLIPLFKDFFPKCSREFSIQRMTRTYSNNMSLNRHTC